MRRGLKSQQLEKILHAYDTQNFSDINSSSISDNENEELYSLI